MPCPNCVCPLNVRSFKSSRWGFKRVLLLPVRLSYADYRFFNTPIVAYSMSIITHLDHSCEAMEGRFTLGV